MSEKERPGVVLVSKFVLPSNKTYTAYIDYIDRSAATRGENVDKFVSDQVVRELSYNGYLFDYMERESHTGEIFMAKADSLGPEEKAKVKTLFETAQQNGSPMWQTVLSFDNTFLAEYGLYDPETKYLNEGKVREITRAAMTKLLDKEGLSGTSVYTACIHYNTDNIHIHIAAVEPKPTREESVLKSVTFPAWYIAEHGIQGQLAGCKPGTPTKITAIKGGYNTAYKALCGALDADHVSLRLGSYITVNADKSVTMSYMGDKEAVPPFARYEERRAIKGKLKKASLDAAKSAAVNCIVEQSVDKQKINDLIRKQIATGMDHELVFGDTWMRSQFLAIFAKLPEDRRLWKYNMNAMQDVRPMLDELSMAFIRKHKEGSFRDLEKSLERTQAIYQRAYGGSQNNYKENKLKDLMSSMGNQILREMRAYDRLIHQHEHSGQSEHRAARRRGGGGRPPRRPYRSGGGRSELKVALFHLSKALGDDYEHFKNLARYEEIEAEVQEQEYEV